jgi:hypothetical protein
MKVEEVIEHLDKWIDANNEDFRYLWSVRINKAKLKELYGSHQSIDKEITKVNAERNVLIKFKELLENKLNK